MIYTTVKRHSGEIADRQARRNNWRSSKGMPATKPEKDTLCVLSEGACVHSPVRSGLYLFSYTPAGPCVALQLSGPLPSSSVQV